MIRAERPPNFAAILAAFPHAGDHGVVFAYGEDIFNPSNVAIPGWLAAHEYRHCARQFIFPGGAAKWWEHYISDSEFRYTEELIAHAQEYAHQLRGTRDRNAQVRLLHRTAGRLTAPLYNYQPPISFAQALREIKALV
jgi:hypothetical protein